MNFIVDENLPRDVAAWLRSKGNEARHVGELGLQGQPDSVLWSHACAVRACIVTRDSDFIRIAQNSAAAYVVRLRIGNCSTPTLLARLEELWPEATAQLAAGTHLVEVG